LPCIALDPTQIKSVYNRGTWDPNDPRILQQTGGEQVAAMSLRDPQYAEQQAKFDALPSLEVNSKEAKVLRGGDGFMGRVRAWIEGKGLFGLYQNGDAGIDGIIFDDTSVDRVVSHGAGDGKVALLQIVPDLIRSGIHLETTDVNTPMKRHIFAGKATIDGTPYAIGFVVREDVNGRRYYDHSLTQLSALDGSGNIGSGTAQEPKQRGASQPLPSRTGQESAANRESVSDIVRKHLGVNPDAVLNSDTPLASLRTILGMKPSDAARVAATYPLSWPGGEKEAGGRDRSRLAKDLVKEAYADKRTITLQSLFKEGDTIETISPETAEEINRLGFATSSSPVLAQKLDHIDKNHGPFTHEDVDALRATIAKPTEVLPNLETEDSPGRADSVLLVRQNGGDYVSIVEIAPDNKENTLWNFWKFTQNNANRYLEKFRQEKERRLQSGGPASNTTPSVASTDFSDPSYSSPSDTQTGGKPESLSGSQTATPSSEKEDTPSPAEVKPAPAPESTAPRSVSKKFGEYNNRPHSPRSTRFMLSSASGNGRGAGRCVAAAA
jgi:hypothetical protein